MMQKIIHGNCLEVLRRATPNSIDAIVTDPPYGLSFMGKKWDYDVPSVEIWQECLRVLKPGGYLLAFAGTRTQHRMAVRIEDAGFEIRDMIAWVYGSGFPKSLNIGKAVDKLQGNEREVVGEIRAGATAMGQNSGWNEHENKTVMDLTKGTSEWEGWGTALKPALEPITMARKPLDEKTVAENCLKWGVGGINIDGSRVATDELTPRNNNNTETLLKKGFEGEAKTIVPSPLGRFPANIIHDGSDEVVKLFPNTKSGAVKQFTNNGANQPINLGGGMLKPTEGSEGSASRFFQKCEFTKDELDACNSMQKQYNKSDNNQSLWNNIYVNTAESLLKTIRAIKENTARLNVDDSQEEKRNRLVLSAEKNARSIEILTALILAEIMVCQDDLLYQEVSIAIQDSTGSSKECSLLLDLVRLVELNENTDITEITQNLLKSFGSALLAIEENTNYERSENDDQIVGGQRFLYQAKASKSERNKGCEELEEKRKKVAVIQTPGVSNDGEWEDGKQLSSPMKNHHPTVKPIALMEYLVKMVSREGALVLDPFAGSGSTLLACKNLGRGYVGIEMDEEYVKIINARLGNTL